MLPTRYTSNPKVACIYFMRASATFLNGCVCTPHERRGRKQQEPSFHGRQPKVLPEGRRSYEKLWQIYAGCSDIGWRVGPWSDHGPGSRGEGCFRWVSGLHSSVPGTRLRLGGRLLQRWLLGSRILGL